MELSERKELFRQLGLPRHEAYEWAKRSLQIPNFDIRFYRNRRHELRSKRISQDKVDSMVVDEIKEKYRKLLKTGSGLTGSRDRDRSLSAEHSRHSMRSERSRSTQSGRGHIRNERGSGTPPPPPVIDNWQSYLNPNNARARSRSPMHLSHHFDESSDSRIISEQKTQNWIDMDHRPSMQGSNYDNQWNSGFDDSVQPVMPQFDNRNTSDKSLAEKRLLHGDDNLDGGRGGNERRDMPPFHRRHMDEKELAEMRLLQGDQYNRSSGRKERMQMDMQRNNTEEPDAMQFQDNADQWTGNWRTVIQQSGSQDRWNENRGRNHSPDMRNMSHQRFTEEESGGMRFQQSQEQWRNYLVLNRHQNFALNEDRSQWDRDHAGNQESNKRRIYTGNRDDYSRMFPRDNRGQCDRDLAGNQEPNMSTRENRGEWDRGHAGNQEPNMYTQDSRGQWDGGHAGNQEQNMRRTGSYTDNQDDCSRRSTRENRNEWGGNRIVNPQPDMTRNLSVNERQQPGYQRQFDQNRGMNRDDNMPRIKNNRNSNIEEHEMSGRMDSHGNQKSFIGDCLGSQQAATPHSRNQTDFNFQSNPNQLEQNRIKNQNPGMSHLANQRGANFYERPMSDMTRFGGNRDRFENQQQSSEMGFEPNKNHQFEDRYRSQQLNTSCFGFKKGKRFSEEELPSTSRGSQQTSMPNISNPREDPPRTMQGAMSTRPGFQNRPSTSKPQANPMQPNYTYRTAKEQIKFQRAQKKLAGGKPSKKGGKNKKVKQLSGHKTGFIAVPENLRNISGKFIMRKIKPRSFWESWWKTHGWIEGKAPRVSDTDPDLEVINALTKPLLNNQMLRTNSKILLDCEKAILESLNRSSQACRVVNAYDFLKSFVTWSALPENQMNKLSKDGKQAYCNILHLTKKTELVYYCMALVGMWRDAYQSTSATGPNKEAAINLIQRDKVFNWLIHLAFQHLKLVSSPILYPVPKEKQLQDLYKSILRVKITGYENVAFLACQVIGSQQPNAALSKTVTETERSYDNMANPLTIPSVFRFLSKRIVLSDPAWEDKIDKNILLKPKNDLLAKYERDPNVEVFESYFIDIYLCVLARVNYLKSIHTRLREHRLDNKKMKRWLTKNRYRLVCKWILERRIQKYQNFEGVENCVNQESCHMVNECKQNFHAFLSNNAVRNVSNVDCTEEIDYSDDGEESSDDGEQDEADLNNEEYDDNDDCEEYDDDYVFVGEL